MTKRLSAMSEVVLLLRGYRKGATFTVIDIEKRGIGVERKHISSALSSLRTQGYVRFVGKDGMYYKYKLVRSVKKYPIRNAPAYSARNRKSGFSVNRLDAGSTTFARLHKNLARMKNLTKRIESQIKQLEKRR